MDTVVADTLRKLYEANNFNETVIDLLKGIKEELHEIRNIIEPKEVKLELFVNRDVSQEDTDDLIVKNC